MRIVLSGGWGYRNLGDDAILDSSISLLQARYPGCFIDVLTYDLQDSSEHSSANVRLHASAHRLLDLNTVEHLCPHVAQDYPRLKRVLLKARFLLAESGVWGAVSPRVRSLDSIEALVQGADLFVMGGGGYFNERWLCKVRSHLIELEIARKHMVPVEILGPTLGRFQGALKARVGEALAAARSITVRDGVSEATARAYSDRVRVVPDVALGSWSAESANDSRCIGVVFTNPNPVLGETLAEGLAGFLRNNPGWSVRLFISRKWLWDFRNTIALQNALSKKGVSADISYPAGFKTLESGLSSCAFVVSENLHGMVIAARNLVPVVAVNDYKPGSPNSNKFLAFLKQIESERYFIDSSADKNYVKSLLQTLADNRFAVAEFLRSFREEVRSFYLSD